MPWINDPSGAPPPFLVTDSYRGAEVMLRMDYGRSIREFRVVSRYEQLLGIEGDVYTLYTGGGSNGAWLLWRALGFRRDAGRINDLGPPPSHTT